MVPNQIVVGVADELLHHRRVVMRCDLAVGQTAGGGFGQSAPLRIGQRAIGFVDLPKERFKRLHRRKRRWTARVGADACNRGVCHLRCGVVQRQALDARFHPGLKQARCAHHAQCAAHRRANPMRPLDGQVIQQVSGYLGVEGQAVFELRLSAPLAQSAPDGVRANHPVAAQCQVGCQFVHVTPGAGQAVPGNHGLAELRTPLCVMDFTPGASRVMGGRTG